MQHVSCVLCGEDRVAIAAGVSCVEVGFTEMIMQCVAVVMGAGGEAGCGFLGSEAR